MQSSNALYGYFGVGVGEILKHSAKIITSLSYEL